MITIGTCSNCGGPVQVPELWGGSVPPTPTCRRCGATRRNPYGPVMPMDRAPQREGAPDGMSADDWGKYLKQRHDFEGAA